MGLRMFMGDCPLLDDEYRCMTKKQDNMKDQFMEMIPNDNVSFDLSKTNELTLTASITSITNAHNSFAITLERDDGTVLQTHTLSDGETSFTFTQTETSYATFNYVVKLNETQTDTYSATFNPPPTPTFDIALTNDDLAITATLTNIVNPDPYYTLMMHDANDTHLDGHTFATTDTTVVLTWTESSYGERTYTKLLNGASIGTETITLTDPNGSTPTINHNTLITIPSVINSSVSSHTWTFVPGESGQSAGQTYDGSSKLVYSFTSTNRTIKFQAGTWADESTTQAPNQVLYNSANGFVELGDMYAGDQDFGAFTSPFFSSASSTPTTPTPVDITLIPSVNWGAEFYYEYFGDDSSGHFYYDLTWINGSVYSTDQRIKYDPINKVWYDGFGQGNTADTTRPNYLVVGSTSGTTQPASANTTSLTNPAFVWGFNSTGSALFAFDNAYYEAPTYRTGTSQGFAFTSGTWKGYGYTAVIDDEANSSSGKLVNGVRQFEWDMPDIGGGRLYSGANNWIYFVPGTAEDNGTWYHSSTSTGGTAGTRNGRVISIGTSATFDETNAFVDGLLPYGDIP
ncbi:unnamed protein product [Bathycoccus prasinos]